MEQEVFMSKEEVIETLNDFVFGNFEISMKVKTAINEAVCMLEARDQTIYNILEIVNSEEKQTNVGMEERYKRGYTDACQFIRRGIEGLK